MRRAAILAVLLLVSRSAYATSYWDQPQNTNGQCGGSPGFLYSNAIDDVSCNPYVPNASVVADTVNTSSVKLSSINSALFTADTVAWVASVGDYFGLRLSALTVDHLTVETANNLSGYQWVRLGIQNIGWQQVTTWYLDPSGTCSDENSGASGHPLCTFAELARRTRGANYTTAVTYNLLSDSRVNDNANFWLTINGGSITIQGTPSVFYTGTVTSFTAQSTTAAADDNELVDNSVPVSFTASGMLADSVIFKRTNSTAVYFWAAKDLGSKTLRTSVPTGSTGLGVASLSPGDTYTAATLPKIYQVRFQANSTGVSADGNITFNQVNINDPYGSYGNVSLILSAFPASLAQAPQVSSTRIQNVYFGQPGNLIGAPAGGSIMNAGIVMAPGGGILSVDGASQVSRVTFQGGRFSVGQQSNVLVTQRLSFYDNATAGSLLIRDNSVMVLSGAIGGLGNSVPIIDIRAHGQVAYNGAIAIFVAGMTSSTTPFLIEPTAYAFSAIPLVNPNGESYIVDYTSQPTGLGIVQSNGSGFFGTVTIGSGLSYNTSTSTLSATGGGGTVTAVTGSGGISVASPSPTPNVTLANFTCGAGTFVSSASTSSGLACTTPVDTGITQLTHDVTAGPGSGSQAANVVGVEDDAVCRGDLLFANEAAPTTPGAGDTRVWADATAKTLTAKDDAGNVSHMARTVASSAGVALTGLANNGSWTTQTFQTPLTACTDYVSVACQTGATDIGGTNATVTITGIENAATMRGDIVATNVAAPSTPATGKTAIYVDNGTKNIVALNDAGVKNHGIQNFTCGTSPQTFIKQVSSDGSSTCAQAAFSDLSGSAACGQMPALTGDVTTSAGSCATSLATIITSAIVTAPRVTYDVHGRITATSQGYDGTTVTLNGSNQLDAVGLTDGSGTNFTTSGSFVAGQPLIATAGNHITTNSLASLGVAQTINFDYFGGPPSAAWLVTGNDSLTKTFGGFAVEYPQGMIAGSARLRCVNGLNTGTGYTNMVFTVTRNASATTTTLSIPASSATAAFDSGSHSLAGGAATDTFGVEITYTGFTSPGGITDFTCTVVLSP